MANDYEVFSLIERIRARAAQLVQGAAGPGPQLHRPAAGEVTQAREVAGRVEERLPHLAETFALPELGVSALVCLLAAELDPFLRHAQRVLQSDGGRPWLELGTVSELLDLPLRAMPELLQLFAAHGALRRWALVEVDERVNAPGAFRRAKIDGSIAEYLVGIDKLAHGTTLVAPAVGLADSLVPPAVSSRVAAQVRRALQSRQPLVVEISGAAGGGRRFFAEALAGALGRPLLIVDLAARDRASAEAWSCGLRDARLHNALPCFANWDVHAPAAAPPADTPAPPRSLPAEMAAFLRQLEGVVMLTAVEREPLVEAAAPSVARVDVPFPTPSQRSTLMAAAVERCGARLAGGVELEAVARRFALAPARIEAAAAAAVDELLGDGDVVSGAMLVEACTRQLRHNLKSVALRMLNNHSWDHLVVADEVRETLREMIAYVRHAGCVYDQWGFGERHSLSQGISALFSGPPGTGKTMCASVIARELDMELFRVDLTQVVSKWVGETEKNLARVFDEAQRSSAIILFDEADSLFAKRTDVNSANDRYANLEVNFLLQRMEQFGGISILTSNHEDAIDPAFKRRLTFRVRFEKPTAGERALLWSKMFPPGAQLAGDVDPELLGRLYDLSGGSIRNAAVRAAFLAADEQRPIDLRACLVGAERECLEMGHLVRSYVDRLDS
jgi:ATPase family associated with various cellular activities (AAA)/Winged helix domain, variant